MDILNTVSLESNTQINFNGGDLSSDAGLLLFKEFLFEIGAVKLINRMFKTNDTARFRIHKDNANLMQVIYRIISAYFEDDCADELTNEPVMTAILNKDALASRPSLSRFFNRMNGDTLGQLNQITRELRKVIISETCNEPWHPQKTLESITGEVCPFLGYLVTGCGIERGCNGNYGRFFVYLYCRE